MNFHFSASAINNKARGSVARSYSSCDTRLSLGITVIISFWIILIGGWGLLPFIINSLFVI